MNKIICDNQECKAEIKLTKDSIETKFLKDGVQINFFRCRSCNTKYLIDVTDKETRSKQIKMSKLIEEKNKLMQNTRFRITNNMTTLKSVELEAERIEEEQNILLKEIKEAKAELKAKYEGEL